MIALPKLGEFYSKQSSAVYVTSNNDSSRDKRESEMVDDIQPTFRFGCYIAPV